MGRASRAPSPPDSTPWGVLVLTGTVGALAVWNVVSLQRLEKQVAASTKASESRLAKVESRLDGLARAQQPQRRGPDPAKVYTVRTDGAPAKGRLGAPIVIAEFSDFQ